MNFGPLFENLDVISANNSCDQRSQSVKLQVYGGTIIFVERLFHGSILINERGVGKALRLQLAQNVVEKLPFRQITSRHRRPEAEMLVNCNQVEDGLLRDIARIEVEHKAPLHGNSPTFMPWRQIEIDGHGCRVGIEIKNSFGNQNGVDLLVGFSRVGVAVTTDHNCIVSRRQIKR